MKFCPLCGSNLNNKSKCDICGYNKKVDSKEVKKNNEIIYDNTMYHIPKTICFKDLKNINVEKGILKSISIYSDNMMAGYSNSIYIDFESNCLIKEDKTGYNKSYYSISYLLSDEEVSKISNMIEEYNLAAWSNLELMLVQDSQSIISISYKRKNNTIKTYDLYPFSVMDEEEKKIYDDFISYIYSLISKDKIVKKEKKLNVFPQVFSSSYCPECGKKIYNNTLKCECGYEFNKKEIKNSGKY